MIQASQNMKVLVLDDYEGFAASVPSYEKVKARAQVVILRTKLKNDTELANALRDVQILLPVRERTKLGDKELALAPEAALVRALERGQLGGVGLDVFDEEPLPFEHPLRRFDNAILLPHRGYATVEVLRERFERAMSNIVDFIEEKPLKLLNPQAVPD
jgi:phosphoglycerate dehydrogenase-like enzyme